MKIHIRTNSENGDHVRCTIFMNGANCGNLCMRQEEFTAFCRAFETAGWTYILSRITGVSCDASLEGGD